MTPAPKTWWPSWISWKGIARGLARPSNAETLVPWRKLISEEKNLWQDAVRRVRSGPAVLIANHLPGFTSGALVDSLLAVALTLRGARAEFLICDEVLPACLHTKFRKNAPDTFFDGRFRQAVCGSCVSNRALFTELGLPMHYYSGLITPAERARLAAEVSALSPEQVKGYTKKGRALGEHAHAGCLRYYSRASLAGEPRAAEVEKKYLEAALQTDLALDNLLDRQGFDAAVIHHGIYIPQGVAAQVCRDRGVRVATWNVAYRKRCLIFSHGDTYHHTLMNEPVDAWKDMEYGPAQDEEIRSYLAGRAKGANDWIYFHDVPDDSADTLARDSGIDPAKPMVGLLTNVIWDAQLHYPANAFPDMLTWIFSTVRYFAARPELQLLIRVHPAELRGLQPSRQFVVDEIRREFPVLAPNIFLVGPESQVNTYAAMGRCNAVIIYGTKTGVELVSMGVPVIVAGEAWIRNKGLTTDVSSDAEYFAALDRLPLAPDPGREDKAAQARRYAYHFFLRRMIPLKCVAPTGEKGAPFRLAVETLEDLLPGRDEGLDVICDGILTGAPFVFKAETRTPAPVPKETLTR